MDNSEIRRILQALGARVPASSRLLLIGGSALALLGSPRLTVDIDFIGDDVSPSELHKTIIQTAKELKIYVDAVPIERFIPLPEGSEERIIRIGKFGNLDVFVADPYSIALSKLERGFDTDLDDILFLIHNGLVDLDELERDMLASLSRASEFDIDPADFHAHFLIVRERLT